MIFSVPSLVRGFKTQKLVGGIPTPLKNMKVSCDHYSQYSIFIWKVIKFMFQITNQKMIVGVIPFL